MDIEALKDIAGIVTGSLVASGSGGDDDDDDDDDDNDSTHYTFDAEPEPLIIVYGDKEYPEQDSAEELIRKNLENKRQLLKILRKKMQQAIARGHGDLARILDNRIMLIAADLEYLTDLDTSATGITENDQGSPGILSFLKASLATDDRELWQRDDDALKQALSQHQVNTVYQSILIVPGELTHEEALFYDRWRLTDAGLVYQALRRRLEQELQLETDDISVSTKQTEFLVSGLETLARQFRAMFSADLSSHYDRRQVPHKEGGDLNQKKRKASSSEAAGSQEGSNSNARKNKASRDNKSERGWKKGDEGEEPPDKDKHTYSKTIDCPSCHGPCEEEKPEAGISVAGGHSTAAEKNERLHKNSYDIHTAKRTNFEEDRQFNSSGTASFSSYGVTKQDEKAEASFSDREALSAAVIELAKFNLSIKWERVASKLNFDQKSINFLKDKHIGSNEDAHLKLRQDYPGYCSLIEEMLTTAYITKKIPPELIIDVLDSVLEDQSELSFRDAQKADFTLVRMSNKSNKKYESYVFLIWIKHPASKEAHPLPNTKRNPVQQNAYDWAIRNPDKLVILWFSGSTLNKKNNDSKILDDFASTVALKGVRNLFLFNVDHIDWGDEKRKKFCPSDKEIDISSLLQPDNPEIKFSSYLNGLRVLLLSRGSSCILSAAKKSSYLIRKDDVPTCGSYFDMDYIPIPFNTYSHCKKILCRDGSFDDPWFYQGRKVFLNKSTPNSMLATVDESLSGLDNWPIFSSYSRNKNMAKNQPYYYSVTLLFRMSDVYYDDKGKKIKWDRDTTWKSDFEDDGFNHPLFFDREKYPAYLLELLKNPLSKNDPMAPKTPPEFK
ncbi:hypothetical protein [Endozoicomonas euniceicola]|uniref:Uncharacterized protein n=1 Tax=Endozoicomonas euniceicola TaxID=1234143 RepID=A0ABY6GZZ1_9GAMM|nr:hypothetical protein [Endozoicomonas euniceicola]UYM17621.1 hypothetical protein NX720_06865 [Endozoicomonas euniceicola]